jgi:SAM-dependent methyltransferase
MKEKRMGVEEFFNLLLEEIRQNSELRGYYRFLDDESKFAFRKSYFVQRLQYISDHISNPSDVIWDCGSGYGTTCIYLAINGFKSLGSTLEYYYKEIENRLAYWDKHGDMTLFSTNYEDIYDSHPEENSTDIIILQDTLHHLEPLQDALTIFNKVLRPGGKIILIEENGSNIIQTLKLYKQRGNKRIIEYYDEKLKKNIIMGNENIRSYRKWERELDKQGFRIVEEDTRFIRYYPPFMFGKRDMEEVVKKEQQIAGRNSILRKYFFFGINFIIEKG